MTSLFERIKGTNEDDVCIVKILIIHPRFQEVGVDHRLVITGALGEFRFCRFIDLHFHVVDGIFIVGNVDIKANALACILKF